MSRLDERKRKRPSDEPVCPHHRDSHHSTMHHRLISMVRSLSPPYRGSEGPRTTLYG